MVCRFALALFVSTLAACQKSPPPSPRTPCTAVGGLTASAALVAGGGTGATGSRYVIPFASTPPTQRLYVAPAGDDTNAGSMSAPKKTLQAAFDSATPGTAIMIKAGTYRENLKLTHSGMAGAPIWLVSADGPALAKLVADNPGDSTVQGYGVHNLVLQGLDVTAPSPTSGDSDGIKFAASGEVNDPAALNSNLAVVDCTVHCATDTGYNGVKISSADGVFIIHNVFDGAGGPASGDALDFVGNTNSEIAYNFATNVPAHAAFQIKGGSTTVVFHHNLISRVGGDGLWIGGGTVEQYMQPSSAYEACNVTARNNVMHDLGNSAVSLVGGVNSAVTHLFTYHAMNHYVQALVSSDHDPAISSTGDSVLDSVFDATQDVLYVDTANQGMVAVDIKTDKPLTITTNAAGHNTFHGGALISAGGGHDLYQLTSGGGATVISGFQVASDLVQLSGYGISDFTALHGRAHQLGPAVLFALPDDYVLMLDGIDLSALTSANFSF